MFREQPWNGAAEHYRPNFAGNQRDSNDMYPEPAPHWLDDNGVVHQASAWCNLTLCENAKTFRTLMVHRVIDTTDARVTCVGCIGDPDWGWYPIDVQLSPGSRP